MDTNTERKQYTDSAGHDRYGHYVMFNGFRSAMPDKETALRAAAALELLDVAKAFCWEHTNPCGCGNCAAIRRAEGRA